jgi:hypothetical protein
MPVKGIGFLLGMAGQALALGKIRGPAFVRAGLVVAFQAIFPVMGRVGSYIEWKVGGHGINLAFAMAELAFHRCVFKVTDEVVGLQGWVGQGGMATRALGRLIPAAFMALLATDAVVRAAIANGKTLIMVEVGAVDFAAGMAKKAGGAVKGVTRRVLLVIRCQLSFLVFHILIGVTVDAPELGKGVETPMAMVAGDALPAQGMVAALDGKKVLVGFGGHHREWRSALVFVTGQNQDRKQEEGGQSQGPGANAAHG